MERRRILWIEFAVVLTLLWLPATVTGFVDYFYPASRTPTIGWESEVSRLVSNIVVIVPLLFILYASGDKMGRFGLRKCGVAVTFGFGFAGLMATVVSAEFVRRGIILMAPSVTAVSHRVATRNVGRLQPNDWIWSARVAIYFVGAFEEELVWRGYAYRRLAELLGRPWLGLVASSALFAVYHIYEGLAFLPAAFLMGIVFGWVRIGSKSLISGTIAHALYNCLALVARGS